MAETTLRALSAGMLLAAGAAGGAWALSAQGCTTSSCDGSYEDWNTDAGAGKAPPGSPGRWLDDNTWESNAIDEDWVPFPHQRSWRMYFRDPRDELRTIVEAIAYISVDGKPSSVGTNFTLGSGNAAEFTEPNVKLPNEAGILEPSSSLLVHNDTCADFYVRVVVHVEPRKTSASVDAGVDPGDASDDAPIDALQDGPIDARNE